MVKISMFDKKVAYSELRGNAFAQTCPVFGIITIGPLKEGGIDSQVVYNNCKPFYN